MRHALYLSAALAALALDALILAFGLDKAGAFALTGLHARSFVIGYFALGIIGAAVSWLLADDVATWSVATQAAGLTEDRWRPLAARLGLKRPPILATYESPDINAFTIARWPGRSRIVVSTGAVQRLSPDDLEALLAHAMAKLAAGDVATMMLLSGMTNPFTLFPTRILSGLVGTSLRTSDEETPIDPIETRMRTACEVLLTPLNGLIARLFGRGAEQRADARGAAVLGRQRMLNLVTSLKSGDRPVTREMFLAPLAARGQVSRLLPCLSYHRAIERRASYFTKNGVGSGFAD